MFNSGDLCFVLVAVCRVPRVTGYPVSRELPCVSGYQLPCVSQVFLVSQVTVFFIMTRGECSHR